MGTNFPIIYYYAKQQLIMLRFQPSPIECVTPIDCKAWQKLGIKINGVYPIKPDSGPAFQVSFR